MSTIAFLRADTDTRLSASDHDEILDRYPTNCQVEVLEEQGDWVKIKPVGLKRTTSGFVPRLALILPQGRYEQAVPSTVQLPELTRQVMVCSIRTCRRPEQPGRAVRILSKNLI